MERPNVDLSYTQGLRYHSITFFIVQLYLIGGRLGEDHITNILKTHVKKRLYYVFRFYWLLHTQLWTQLGEHVYLDKVANKHAILIKTDKRISIVNPIVLLMLYYRLANATHISLWCKSKLIDRSRSTCKQTEWQPTYF